MYFYIIKINLFFSISSTLSTKDSPSNLHEQDMHKKQFRVYQSPTKTLSSHFQLQIIIKKNPKTLKDLQCKGLWSVDGLVKVNVTESPKLGSLAKLLKNNNKSISSINLHIEESRLYNFQRIFLALKNLQSLATLYFYSRRSRSIAHKAFKSFVLCTKNLKQLANLDCNLYAVVKVIKPLRALHYIAPFRLLSHLVLRLFSENWITRQAWRSFSYDLPLLTSLTSLNLTMNFYDAFTEKTALYFFSTFSKLPQLASLDFSLVGCESPDFPVLRLLFENLKNLLHFQDLTLCLRTCRNLKSDGQDLLAAGLALLNPASFRKFSATFYSGFSDPDLSQLLVVIQRFSALTHLSLRFSDSDQVTDKGLSDLPAALSQFPALKALNLSISYAIKTGPFFEMISSCLGNLKELVSFTINTFQSEVVDNLGVLCLFSQLPHLLKLENLGLILGPNSMLDEKCIESLAQAFRSLTGLKSLLLDWRSDERITDLMYEGLIERFGHLKRLRKLSIKGPMKMNKEKFGVLGASVKSLESLNDLFIKLQVDSEEETLLIESFDNFIGLLESMGSLTQISLVFDQFEFSEKSIKITGQSLKHFRLVN